MPSPNNNKNKECCVVGKPTYIYLNFGIFSTTCCNNIYSHWKPEHKCTHKLCDVQFTPLHLQVFSVDNNSLHDWAEKMFRENTQKPGKCSTLKSLGPTKQPEMFGQQFNMRAVKMNRHSSVWKATKLQILISNACNTLAFQSTSRGLLHICNQIITGGNVTLMEITLSLNLMSPRTVWNVSSSFQQFWWCHMPTSHNLCRHQNILMLTQKKTGHISTRATLKPRPPQTSRDKNKLRIMPSTSDKQYTI